MKNPGITAGSIEMKSQYSRVDEHIIDKSTPGTASESKSSAGSPHYLCPPQRSQAAMPKVHAMNTCFTFLRFWDCYQVAITGS